MPPRDPSHVYLSKLSRRTTLALALPLAARWTIVLAVTLVALFAIGRSFAFDAAPRPWWLAALVPLAVSAWLWARRRLPGDLALCTFADRQVGARGLLLLGLERDLGAWSPGLDQALARSAPPAVAWAGSSARIAAAIAVVSALAFVPIPEPSVASPRQAAIQNALERLREDMKAALEVDALRERETDELKARADELEQRVLDGDPVTWADVDALHDALQKQEDVQRNELTQLVARAKDLVRSGADEAGPSAADLAELARLAQELDLGRELSPELRAALERLQQAMAGKTASERSRSGLDPKDLEAAGLDAEQLKALAKELSKLGGNRLAHAAASGRVPDPDLGDLRDLLAKEGMLGEGTPNDAAPAAAGQDGFDPKPHDGDPDGAPGRGGISRGRGDAALEHSGATEIDTSKLKPERLVPGQPYHDRWQELGAVPAEPVAAPGAIEAGGGTAAEGRGAASFHRDLAPRHRAVVERFFTPDSPPSRRR